MDWSNPVAKRTRQSQALYFKELHKRIKHERSSGGGGGYGIFESGSDSGGSVVGGLKRCSGEVEGGREMKNSCEMKGEIETVSDEDDDVVLVGGGNLDSEERSGDNVGVSVEDKGDGVDANENMETSSSRMWSRSKAGEDDEEGDEVRMRTEAQVENEEEDVVLINYNDENEEEGDKMNGVVLESNEEEESVDDVDSNWLSDSDYEVNESRGEVEFDDGDDDGCYFAERPQKKIDCSNRAQESGKWIYWNEDQGKNGWISYYTPVQLDDEDDDGSYFSESQQKKIDCSNKAQESGKWIYWNEDQGKNGWISYYTQVQYDDVDDDGRNFSERPQKKNDSSNKSQESGESICLNEGRGRNGWIAYNTRVEIGSDSVEGNEKSINDIGVARTATADGSRRKNYSTKKKDIKAKHNINMDSVGTLKNNSPEFNTRSKSKKTEDGSLSQPSCIGVDEEDDNDSLSKQMSNSRKVGKSTNLKRSRPLKWPETLKVLVDSMLNDNDGPLEQLPSQQLTGPSTTKETLPLKFTFGVPKTKPPQKSEFEKNLDELWAEFDFALAASEMDTTSHYVVDQREDSTPELATKNTVSYCHKGHHVFVIDEEIGVKCKHCSLVKLEIKHFMPSFSKYPYGRFEKKHIQDEDDYAGFKEIPFEDVGCNSQSDCGRRIYAKGTTVWDLIPDIRKGMHPHQQEGFEFIWKNITGGIYLSELQKRSCTDSGNGCIISHAPGTGKSLLTIVFLQTYMKLYPACRPVIIAPRSMLLSWEAELHKWKVGIPFHNLNMPDLSGAENAAAIKLLGRAKHHISSMRLLKLYSWKKDGGILGLSYKLYECLAGENRVEGKRKGRYKECHYERETREVLLQTPNLLVLDEGHTPRNERSLIWKALCKIQTEKRIILSGTPFQNNFEELFNTLCIVRPKFADSIQPDCYGMRRRRLRKVSAAKGKWHNLTSPIGKFEEGNVSDYNLEELRCMLESFVHIYKGNILQKSLPGLRDSVIVLRPAEFQKSILEGVYHLKSSLKRNYVASLVSLHPSLLPESERAHFPGDKDKFERFRLDPEAGVKTKFVMELIRLSEATKEKVLVFSEYIDPLNFIRDLLKSHFGWTEGEEILYMDGQIDVRQRQSSINTFNDLSSEARVLLASKRACSEGINLVGASRVVLLDVVWNPSVERQAISRAYRLGQKRVVHVYQLISGTIEWDKYCLQAKKSWLSELVFSSTDRDENAHVISNAASGGDNILEEMVQHSSIKDMLEKIIHQPKESSLIQTFGLVDQEGTL